ncbi:helix-turn-helix domain-containing protein [Nocardiopsis lucentensis]|uniref:helix-turn-helix domain-containing protein n=1 Tax=Nocardiopsis lucentensis TaxID=53441 RepID=UPI0003481D05|nr:helix-turn-helix domain-containing protein [Nocardiopsis lucentensis]
MSIQHMQMVFDAGDLTAPQKAVLLAYCNFTDAHGYCWPGVERIADMTGLSASGVKKVRKQLIEAKLMTTVSRGKKGGGRKTNGSRINVKKLQKMKLPPREYDDNIVPELGFEEDHEPEETGAKVPEGHTNGSPEVPQRYPEGTNEGTCGDPYPSVDPSGNPSGEPSSSSVTAEGEAEPESVPAPATKKMKTVEQIIIDKLSSTDAQPQGGPPTPDEATAVKRRVIAQAAADGVRVHSPAGYLSGRDVVLLEQDLAAVRGHQTAAGEQPGGWSWENQLRAERRARNRHTPYKNPENQDMYDEPLLPAPRPQAGARGGVVTAEGLATGRDVFRI